MDITEIVSALIGVAALVGIGVRLIPRWRPRGSLGFIAHGLVVVIMCLSQSWIYEPVDHLLGGRNLANLLSHLALVAVIWISAMMLTPILYGAQERPRWSPIPVAISIAGTVVAFFAIGSQTTSRGLDAYDAELAHSLYWTFTLMGMWFPAPWFVPKLWRQRNMRLARLRVSFMFLLAAYVLSVPCVAGFFVSAWNPEWIVLREALVFSTAITLALGYMTAPMSRKKKSDVDRTRKEAHQGTQSNLAA